MSSWGSRSLTAALVLFLLGARSTPSALAARSVEPTARRVIVTFAGAPLAVPPGPDRAERRRLLVEGLHQRAAAAQGRARALMARLGVHEVRQLWAINAMVVPAFPEVLRALEELPEVVSIRADALLAVPRTAAAESGASSWNLDAVGARELWAQGHTGAGAVVATLDTGVDLHSAALANNWRGGANSWLDPHGEHALPYDADGHGTRVMSLIAGGELNGTPIGVAPGALWIAAKIFDDQGWATLSDIHLAFQWLLDPDGDPRTDDAPDVVNNSWGFSELVGLCDDELAPDIALLRSADIAVVFAAGNLGPQASTSIPPANTPGALAIGAVDAGLVVAPTSSRGPGGCDGDVYPELTAPGVTVLTADLSLGGIFPDASAYASGTSFAAAHVSGAIALLRSARPSAQVVAIEAALTTSASDLGAQGPDDVYGHGIVDAAAALAQLDDGAVTCTDDDEDGYFAEPTCGTAVDCAPSDPSIHPGACDVRRDGIDQDCDGADRTRGKQCK